MYNEYTIHTHTARSTPPPPHTYTHARTHLDKVHRQAGQLLRVLDRLDPNQACPGLPGQAPQVSDEWCMLQAPQVSDEWCIIDE